ncbi:MAG: 1-(5-phosphoribosyl)-5-[(5-phosphoribosylamino)methylideneamino]imidazole-4-carboxamide isomerase [Eubacteriaceae bacterium]|jgi:phosphoribosylformimino-5-aminoimidazole carboxamide ribotide isomerase|nr:1-(5-phosphoribosyl)-5-[(5-phosphoribosylamino)methylideneamino]imidazole-4-carboxamide isomerase [Eubacteriaceae bacterium]
MRIFAAIDILDEKAVRLAQGDFSRKKVYDADPLDAAMRMRDMGATSLHIVDLNAAKEGSARNLPIIEKICSQTSLFVESGGGVRSFEAAQALFSAGVSRVVVGTKAVTDPIFAQELSQKYPHCISVGLDAKCGVVMTRGWTASSGLDLVTVLPSFDKLPLASIIVTDISRDGMLEGVSADFYKSIQSLSQHEITASGGVAKLEDLVRLKDAGIRSAIVGKALYEGAINIGQAIERVKAPI